MSTYWSPKPLRPESANPIFQMVEAETVVKGLSPMQVQRQKDGTPLTRQGLTGLRPADPELTLRGDLVKGSYVEKVEEKTSRYGAPKTDPQDPLGVIKAYLEHDEDKKLDKSAMVEMQAALEKFSKACNSVRAAAHESATTSAESPGTVPSVR